MTPITVQLARPEDAPAAGEIVLGAALWLAERGEMLWNPAQFTPGWAAPFITCGELYLAWTENKPVATLLLQEDDSFFWPDMPPGDSLFVHKLAVNRAFAGQGITTALLAFAQEEARRRHKRYLRLDCDSTRPKLCAVYEAYGFVRHSLLSVKPEFVSARYQIVL